ncbi:hypothetical protein [Methanimicrococcus hacksteinii]|uniref:hypothetical protein n=1 Tax=Methanimicrococcus hacksteinii TaxID=3028293 RepID=UPI00298EE198|nr:hypothetical protein [Methanimicrococcus sp. At1]
MKANVLLFIFALVVFFIAAGPAAAEIIEVSDGQEFRDAVNTTNSNTDPENEIILLNDINLTDDLFTEDEFKAAENPSSAAKNAVGLNYSKSGTLAIKSDSSAVRKINSSLTVPDYYLYLNISGNDISLSSENVLFDGVGINIEKIAQDPQIKNIQIKDIQIVNCNRSGFYADSCDNLSLENVSVTNCKSGTGGGLFIWYTNVTIQDCNISDNTATVSAGGIRMLESNVKICGDTNICNNTVSGIASIPRGGGIYAERTNLKIYGNTNLSDNTVSGDENAVNALGGGIFFAMYVLEGTVPDLEIYENTLISNNTAVQGGGIFLNYNTSDPSHVFNISGDAVILNNSAEITVPMYDSGTGGYVSARGGGIYSLAPVNISGNAVIQNNKAIDTSSNHMNTLGGGLYTQGTTILSNEVQVIDNEADSGGGICSLLKSLTLKDKVLISGNKAQKSGGGINFQGDVLVLQNNATVAQNEAGGSGGGVYLLSDAEISDFVEISDNIAHSTGGGGGGIFMSASQTNISGNVLIRGNTAPNGGGIFAQNKSVISFSNNTTFEKNNATNESGLGGALLMMDGTTADVSGAGGQAVSFSQNTASDSGGAVYIDIDARDITPEELAHYGDFQKKTDESDLVFRENSASAGYRWDLSDSDPSNLSDAMKYIQTLPAMENTTFTEPFTNAYNNFDIYFSDGEKILSVTVPVNYFADSLDSSVIETEDFKSYEGAEIIEDDIISQFGDKDWINWYQPSGYKAGQLNETLPLTVKTDTVLNVLYVKDSGENPGNGSSGGGSGGGTGSATVVNPDDSGIGTPPSNQVPSQNTSPGEPNASNKPIIIVLLFMTAIACYAYVEKAESEKEM